MEGSRILTIRPNEFNFDREGYNFTKVLGVKCYVDDGRQKIVRTQPTTWASLARIVIDTYSNEIDKEVEKDYSKFESTFNEALHKMLEKWGGRPNTSFSDKLFTFPINTEREIAEGRYPDHLRSTTYKNNANCLLKIFEIPDSTEAEYITAVYSGEVVWILNALITTLEQYDAFIEIEYISRNDLKRQIEELEDEERQLSMDDIKTEEHNICEQVNGESISDLIAHMRCVINKAYKEESIKLDVYKELDRDLDHISILCSRINGNIDAVMATLESLSINLLKNIQ